MAEKEKKRLPIGYEDFKEVIDEGLYYVDKTMFIYDLLRNRGKNNLITRPRRFGKTLNFSMLKYFFDITEKDNAYLFDGLKISEHFGELARYRNAYPVIMLSLKCGKQGKYDAAVYSICKEIQRQFRNHKYIIESGRVNDGDRQDFKKLFYAEPDARLFGESIKLLSECLMQHYGKKVIILIDEYDVPLEDAYFSGYYDDMVRFIRSLFESALKTNPALEFSVITGCLRISKESIFTGLNNLEVNSILSDIYSDFFGFVQPEVDDMLRYYGIQDKRGDMKKWYDGYTFGGSEVYNPWSVLCQTKAWAQNSGALIYSWWTNSSSNSIIRTLIEHSGEDAKSSIEKLMRGGSIETYIKETVTYGDLTDCSENIWSFLLFTGYLKVRSVKSSGTKFVYSLIIPNLEIHGCYTDIIDEYFSKYKKTVDRGALYKALLGKDAGGFAEMITDLLKKSISYYDNAEAFYHGLIAGLLSGNIYYRAVSNRETGSGRSDLILYQNDRFINAVIMEFKVCRANEEITAAAQRALRQIDERDYAAEARGIGYKNIIKYGIAFKDKICFAIAE